MERHVVTPAALRAELEDWYALYAEVIDDRLPNDWVAMFEENGVYGVGTRDNIEKNGSWWYVDRGIINLKERAAYASGYFWQAPNRMTHMITNIRARESEDGVVHATAAFVIFAANRTEDSRLHVVGRYRDQLVRREGRLSFLEHRAIIDAETVPANMGILV